MTAFNQQAGQQLDPGAIALRLNALEMGSGFAPLVPILFPNGSAAAPSIAFASTPTVGIAFNAGNSWGFVGGSKFTMSFNFSAFGDTAIPSAALFGWSSTADATGTPDVRLFRDSANTLAQRNGVNAQSFNIYNTFTDASNSERGFMRWSGNQLQIGTEALGTGTIRGVNMVVGGLPVLFLNSIPSSVNYIGFAGGTTLAPVTISAAGSDTNVAIKLANQGTAITLLTGQTIGTTVGAAGAASALPATPAQYLSLSVNGTTYKVPLYN